MTYFKLHFFSIFSKIYREVSFCIGESRATKLLSDEKIAKIMLFYTSHLLLFKKRFVFRVLYS